ncbi:hypothetical protein O1Q81_00818 [Lonepinella sp. MS14436]
MTAEEIDINQEIINKIYTILHIDAIDYVGKYDFILNICLI